METYYIISNYFSGYTVNFLDILSIMALILGIIVIIIKNPIGSLISLIMLFGAISVYLIIIGLTFIGFSYLIVYIGAVSILFLFILMLINIRTSELQSNNSNSIPLAISIGILLNYVLFEILPYYITTINNKLDIALDNSGIYSIFNNILSNWIHNNSKTNIMLVTSNNWDNNLTETSHISAIGNILYTSYNIWLLIAGFILLLSMIGAIVITIKSPATHARDKEN